LCIAGPDPSRPSSTAARRRIAALASAAASLLVLAAQAQALTLSNPLARPNDPPAGTTQTGAATRFHVHIEFGQEEDVRNLTFELPAGLTLNPQAFPTCADGQFTSDTCPTETKVADASATANLDGFVVGAPGAIYNLAPEGGQIGRLGVVLRPPLNLPKVFQIATISRRADSGLSIAMLNIPRTVGDAQVHLDSIDAELLSAFVTNPSTCAAATTRFVASSYQSPSAETSVSDGYTPTGCPPPPPPPPNPPSARCDGRPATKVGSAGRDTLRGTPRRDVIAGLGGNDTILGFAGNDLLCGGAGADQLKGGIGKDVLIGGPAADTLLGGVGVDVLRGGAGADRETQ
jgi:RTX calcium-binding nonapeptide repeat (4 copies)